MLNTQTQWPPPFHSINSCWPDIVLEFGRNEELTLRIDRSDQSFLTNHNGHKLKPNARVMFRKKPRTKARLSFILQFALFEHKGGSCSRRQEINCQTAFIDLRQLNRKQTQSFNCTACLKIITILFYHNPQLKAFVLRVSSPT